ncbi:MAG: hypothetical protein DELT_01814 [Desulfovibrio sp.]
MNTIQQTVTISADRRLQLDVALPESVPVGQADLLLVLSPKGESPAKTAQSVLHFAGRLKNSATFCGVDSVQLQKAMRDEW